MGCLIELFFEIFVEVIIELFGYCYIKLMQLIVPNKTASEKVKRIIKGIATTIAALLVVFLIIGLVLLVQDDPFVKTIGSYMTYIPLAMMVLQIAAGIVLKIINHFKK